MNFLHWPLIYLATRPSLTRWGPAQPECLSSSGPGKRGSARTSARAVVGFACIGKGGGGLACWRNRKTVRSVVAVDSRDYDIDHYADSTPDVRVSFCVRVYTG